MVFNYLIKNLVTKLFWGYQDFIKLLKCSIGQNVKQLKRPKINSEFLLIAFKMTIVASVTEGEINLSSKTFNITHWK